MATQSPPERPGAPSVSDEGVALEQTNTNSDVGASTRADSTGALPAKPSPKGNKRSLYFGVAGGGVALIGLLAVFGFGVSGGGEPAEPEKPPVAAVVAPEPSASSELDRERQAILEQAAKAQAELDRLKLENEQIQAEKAALESERAKLEAQRRADESRELAKSMQSSPAVKQTASASDSPAFKAILEKSKKCYKTQDYDCAINSAEIGLDLVPGNKELKTLIAESRKRQAEALNNIVIQ